MSETVCILVIYLTQAGVTLVGIVAMLIVNKVMFRGIRKQIDHMIEQMDALIESMDRLEAHFEEKLIDERLNALKEAHGRPRFRPWGSDGSPREADGCL